MASVQKISVEEQFGVADASEVGSKEFDLSVKSIIGRKFSVNLFMQSDLIPQNVNGESKSFNNGKLLSFFDN